MYINTTSWQNKALDNGYDALDNGHDARSHTWVEDEVPCSHKP